MMTTNRNQFVPGNLAGEASARQMMPSIWNNTIERFYTWQSAKKKIKYEFTSKVKIIIIIIWKNTENYTLLSNL